MGNTVLNTPLSFGCGKVMKNRFMLAPLTNRQSHEDGTLSEDEFHWLTMRAKGQFGLVMTCASNVQQNGQCWPGQLGIYDDKHIAGHRRLAEKIQEYGSLAVIQLHHGGMRSIEELMGEQPVCPSANEETNARAMSLEEVEQLREDFITAAIRAQEAGYDGVELHGAHGYILCQFLSSEINHREDQYGGSLENRSRLLFEIVEGVRAACGKEFMLGVRLSPERFGMKLSEVKIVAQQLIDSGKVDFLDISLWDVFKNSDETGEPLMETFTNLDRKGVPITVAGKIHSAEDVKKVLAAGIDFVSIGKSAILHHDFPEKVIEDDHFQTIETPVSRAYLRQEGLGETFIHYMAERWEGFVEG
ncbi:NADH:flavin oxidoreductase [Algivirga pacifica]|uniref:NADH-dependent flavin oxidoreductase n=1 Tax=Algivirga pacifica TaxID=1162670 RepID=A0ABP9DDY7_9BACT